MMRSKDEAYLASGLYALGEVSLSYKEKDLVAFRTHGGLWDLIGELERHVVSNKDSVRSQAVNAVRKIDDAGLSKSILSLRAQIGDMHIL